MNLFDLNAIKSKRFLIAIKSKKYIFKRNKNT